MNRLSPCIARGLHTLDLGGAWIGLLGIRLLLAYEFGIAGLEKLRGENWFADIQGDFPFPFSIVPVELSWFLATWTELISAAALVIGLGTRFWAVSLLILDIVAWASVHGANGYNVCDNGYKLPLIYALMLLPLVLSGPGRLSIDHWIRTRFGRV
ncbi:MAG: DoxX family protein [Thiobacillus sp.]|uniref:HvfX family Cu-binding RiPP maturation protein n=1 Tax=Thiobacillus sp. TaxID=924 RepID=UPI0027352487|nr:DoxX family protein [Thiobacillus sp.]MDP3584227.1 DoxX family protein [Thiobacillus sp.]